MKKIMLLYAVIIMIATTGVSAQTISIDSVTDITYISVRVHLNFNSEVDIYVRVNYGPGLNVNYTNSIGYYVPAGTDTTSIVLTGLNPNSSYSCIGFIYYPVQVTSDTVSFTTSTCSLSVSISSVVLNSCSEQLTATSGFSSYQWKRNGANIAGATSSVYVAISDGSYTVVVGDASSCTGTSSAVAVDVDEISITASVDQEICAGESITLTATGGTSYLWSDGSTGSSNSVSPLATTTYTVTGTSDGCSNSDQVQVKVNPLPSVSLTASEDAICVDAVANISFLVSPAGGTLSGTGVSGTSFSHTVAGVGLHTVTYSYTDANGCTNTDNTTIEVLSPPSVSGIEYKSDNGGTLILTGSFPDPIEVIVGGYIYSPVVQSSVKAIFMGVSSLNKGDILVIQSVEGGCFVIETYLSVGELSLDENKRNNKDKQIFDVQGQIVNKNKSELAPGIYIQARKKFVVIERNF